MMNEEQFTQEYLNVIKDKGKRTQVKKEYILNQIEKNAIQYNTLKMINQRNKNEGINEILKPNTLYSGLVDETNKIYLNKMPYLLFGLVESVFFDEEKGKQRTEYGSGILVDKNIILLSAKNLIYEGSDSDSEEEEDEENKENKNNETNKEKEKSNYILSKAEFQPLNLSPDYRSYLPSSIRVIDQYTPLKSNDKF